MDDFRPRFLAFKNRSGVSFTSVGKALKLSATSVKAWADGEPGEVTVGEPYEMVAAKIGPWLETELAKERIQTRLASIPECVPTPVLKKFHAGFAVAKALGKIFVGTGCPGSGKTTAARAAVQGRHDCWYLMIEPATGHLRECLSAIATVLRCNMGNATTYEISRAIIERLSGTGGLLILDEAQHLGFASLEQIRVISEKSQIGVALIGNSVIYSQMGGGRRSSGFDQLRSRIVKRIELPAMTIDDIQPVVAAFGVRGESELAILARIARNDGALRDVVNVLQTILIEYDDGEISVERIVETWHEFSGELLRPQRPADRTPKPEVARIGRAG